MICTPFRVFRGVIIYVGARVEMGRKASSELHKKRIKSISIARPGNKFALMLARGT
jgi:hypothetical protein